MSIIVSGLYHKYNAGLPTENISLEDISFEAAAGEIVSVLGHTGSGKSTLAQHLNALILPQAGSVIVDGVASGRETGREIRRKVGLVFQYPEEQLFAESISEEISFAPKNWGCTKAETEDRVLWAAECVGLPREILDSPPLNISGGQKRRVAIASVISARPAYLVLDEPTAGLDAGAASALTGLLRRFASAGMGVVHITHDIELALSISDKILVLEKGRQVSWGTPENTASFIASGNIKGLAAPEILRLSYALRNAGKISRLYWVPELLAEEIKGRLNGIA